MIQKKFLIFYYMSTYWLYQVMLHCYKTPFHLIYFNILQNNFNNPSTPAIESETPRDFFSICKNPKYQGNKALKTIYDRMNFAFKEKPRLSNEYVYPTLKGREIPIEIIGAQSNVSLLFAALTKNEDET